jgi:hypothetical protein
MKVDGMGRTCSKHGRDEKWIDNFSWKPCMEKTTWENLAVNRRIIS